MKKTLRFAFACLAVAGLAGILICSGCNPDDETPGSGGTLNLYGIDPHTLDPALSGDATSHEFITQIFSGLVKLDEDLEVTGDIAREWNLSADGITYTFFLREDVWFHNGKHLSAHDFKASWERACDPATGSQTAPVYLGDIKGAAEKIGGQVAEISGLRVLDDYILEVTLDEPKSYFLYKLAYPTAFVVDTDTTTGAGWWHSGINATGPFKMKEWQPGSRLELERFEDYYGQPARLEKVVFHLWAGVVMDLYETGEIDVAGVGLSYIEKARDERNIFYTQLIENPALSVMYIGFNVAAEPFDDPLVRQAFAMAIDKEKIVDLVFKSSYLEAAGLLPPGLPGYNDDLHGQEFDIAGALDLIARSGYGSVDALPAITLTTGGYGGIIPSELEAVVYQWEQNLGVEVTVRQLEVNEFYYDLTEQKDHLFYYGWSADYPHPQNFLEVLFGQGSPNNTGEYYSADFEALISQAAREPDFEAALELYRQAEQVLLDDTALIPLVFGVDQVLVKPYVKGYEPGPLGVVRLNEVWIDAG